MLVVQRFYPDRKNRLRDKRKIKTDRGNEDAKQQRNPVVNVHSNTSLVIRNRIAHEHRRTLDTRQAGSQDI
jgi:hypothetical protein